MRRSLIAILVASLWASIVTAQAQRPFDIPAQPLDTALFAFGEQARISVGGIDTRIATGRSHAVQGVMSVQRALEILLRGTGYEFWMVDATTVRIQKASAKIRPRRQSPDTASESPSLEEVVVTASKQQLRLGDYPGTVLIAVAGEELTESAGTATLVARLPTLAATNLGPGRNKLFVRGIADSSFSGPTQSTVGLYLGDLRLTYNAPEPDLRLYDIERVEVLEGPQGTLYGAGTLGGVIRYIPRAPDMSASRINVTGGLSTTSGADPGFDVSATFNQPLVTERLALRATLYRQFESGTTNNLSTGETRTDDTHVQGLRAQLRYMSRSDWLIDLGGVVQYLETRDAHYAERDLAARTRAAAFAQPHENDFRAANLAFSGQSGSLQLVSSTGWIQHDLSSVFDASGYQARPGLLAYREDEQIRLITHESRISHADGEDSAVAGISVIDSSDQVFRKLGAPGLLQPLAALENSRTELAVFAQTTRGFAQRWALTLGARLGYTRSIGEWIEDAGEAAETRRSTWRVLPTAALSWRPADHAIAFLRYQSGFRGSGTTADDGQGQGARRFAADAIDTIELGARFGSDESGVSGGVAAVHSLWRSIQADLINPSGLPYTDNIGDGSIDGIEANLVWKPTPSLSVRTALFINDSALRNISTAAASLPNIPKTGAQASVDWTMPLGGRWNLQLGSAARFTGVSRLATTPPLLLEQGETLQLDMHAAIASSAWRLALECTNLLDARGNIFSYGNPFSAGLGRQITPQHPRTLRLGFSFSH